MTVTEGMDPEVIRRIAADLKGSAKRADDVWQTGSSLLKTLTGAWEGADLEQFSAGWDLAGPRLAEAAAQLKAAAEALIGEAEQQEGTSSAAGGGNPFAGARAPGHATASGPLDALIGGVKDGFRKVANVWDDVTGKAGRWLDEHGAAVRKFLGEHVNLLRGFQKVANVVGPALMAAGGLVMAAGVFTGPGELALGPIGGALMTAGGWVWGAGDLAGTAADWGEGTIDGQGVVKQAAATVALSAIPLGLGKLGKLGIKLGKHGDDVVEEVGQHADDGAKGGARAGEEVGTPPKGSQVDLDKDVPGWAHPKKEIDRTGPDGDLYPDDYRPTGTKSEQEFYDQYWDKDNNSWRYPPDDGFAGPRVPAQAEKGDIIDRFGLPSGEYASPAGTPFDQRAIPPSSVNYEYHQYRVLKPLDGVDEGQVAPWFEQPGGGTQYKFPKDRPLQWYVTNEYLEKIR